MLIHRSSRHLLALLTAVWITVSLSLPGMISARAETTGASTATDLIILIDDSNSMFGTQANPKGNDPNGYRKEAASIMLNMCEIAASRAAVLSFGDKPQDLVSNGMNYQNGLLPISQAYLSNREKLTDSIASDSCKHINTDVAKALKRAQEIFEKTPPIEGNQRVILLISDNQPYTVTEGDSKETPEQTGAREALAVIQDNPLFDPAKPNSIKIYVVELSNDSFNTKSNEDPYKRIARATGGNVYPASSAAELPASFTEILADQIGSTLTTVKATARSKGDGDYGIRIRIPNQSVAEANLLINTEGILPNSIRLFKPLREGQTTAEQAYTDGKTVFFNTTKSFAQYKIASSQESGVWELTYSVDPAAQSDTAVTPAVSVTVLFSYNLQLCSEMQAANGTDALNAIQKNDTLNIGAWFADETGQPSADSLLYQPFATDDDGNTVGIQVRAYALPANQKNVAGAVPSNALVLTPTSAGNNRFGLKCKPADLGITKAGDYLLYLHAEGDGLVRDLSEPISFTVVNNPPIFLDNGAMTLSINDPNSETMGQAVRLPISLSNGQLCTDKDAGLDSLTLAVTCGEDSAIRYEDENDQDDAGVLIAVRAGSCSIDLIVNDGDQGGLVRQTVPVEIVDISQMLRERYLPEIIMTTPAAENGNYSINQSIAFTLRLTDTGSNAGASIDGYPLSPTLTLTGENGTHETIPLSRTEGVNEWTGTVNSSPVSRKFTLDASILTGLPANGFTLNTAHSVPIVIENLPPTVIAKGADAYRYTYWVDPMPWQKADTSYTLDLTKCFQNDDLPENLRYFAKLLPANAAAPLELKDAEEAAATEESNAGVELAANGVLTLKPYRVGEYCLVCGVSDSNQQTVMFTRDVSIRSLTQEFYRLLVRILAIVAGSALIIGTLVWLFMPYYKNVGFDLSRNGSFQKFRKLPHEKRKLWLSAYQPDLSGQDAAPVLKTLSSLSIRPAFKRRIYLRLKNTPPAGISVELHGKTLKAGSHEKIRLNELLLIKSRQNGVETAFGWRYKEDQPLPHISNAGLHPVQPVQPGPRRPV